MCPDSELLSAWVDDEVPSPWRESLERHVAGCPTCTDRIKQMAFVKAVFKQDVTRLDNVAERFRARVFDGILLGVPARAPLWKRPVPIPFAAAAAAGCAFIVLALALAMSGARNSELRLALQSASAVPQVASANTGMDSIFEFLSRQEGSVNITISLPAGSFPAPLGDPFMIREVDYRPGSGK